jgi:hypothetical protein
MNLTTQNGYEFQIDDDDFNKISKYHWWGKVIKRTLKNGVSWLSLPYIYTTPWINGKGTTLYLHQVILDCPKGFEIDHANGDGSDNRKENLRVCTKHENRRNSQKNHNNTSGYKGVFYRKDSKNWSSQIRVNGKIKKLGSFKTKEEAAIAYNVAAQKYYKEFAKLNPI